MEYKQKIRVENAYVDNNMLHEDKFMGGKAWAIGDFLPEELDHRGKGLPPKNADWVIEVTVTTRD